MNEAKRKSLVLTSMWLIPLFVLVILAAMFSRSAHAQSSGPVNTPLLNKAFYFVGTSPYATTIQSAVTAACVSSPGGAVVIPAGVAPTDSIGAVTGGCTKAWILDQRAVTEACYASTGGAYAATACTAIAAIGANQVLGALTAGLPGGLQLPSCASSTNGLTWTNGTGFGCNTYSFPASLTVGSTPITGGTSGRIEYNNAGVLGERAPTGTGTAIVSSTTAAKTTNDVVVWSSVGDAIDSSVAIGNIPLLNATTNTFSGSMNINGAAVVGSLVDTGTSVFAGQMTIENVTAATSTANQSSPATLLSGKYWDGSSGSNTDAWTVQPVLGTGVNPSSTLTFSHLGTPGLVSVQVPALTAASIGAVTPGTGAFTVFSATAIADFFSTTVLLTSTAATSSANINSPPLKFGANYWSGSTSQQDVWQVLDVLGTGANPTTTLTFSHTSGSTGAQAVSFPNLYAAHFSATGAIVNTAYFQFATATACNVTATAFNTCVVNVTLPVTEPDTNYTILGCELNSNVSGALVAQAGASSTTNFGVEIVSYGLATSNLALTCLVIHP